MSWTVSWGIGPRSQWTEKNGKREGRSNSFALQWVFPSLSQAHNNNIQLYRIYYFISA